MQDDQQTKALQEIASAVVSESPESMKLAVIDDNYIAGILKNLLIKAKRVPKNRITHIDYYTSEVFSTPKGCDIAIVSTMNTLRQFKIIPPTSCKEIVIFQEDNGKVKTTRLNIPADRMEGTSLSFKLA
jgi:hypothetical protein